MCCRGVCVRVRTSGVGLGLVVFLVVAGCGGDDDQGAGKGPTPKPGGTRSASSGKRVTYADLPTPSAAEQAAYMADLDKIAPAIVAGGPSWTFVLSNSMGTCLELANHQDPQRILTETVIALDNEQAQLTRDEGARVVEAIHRDLCPVY